MSLCVWVYIFFDVRVSLNGIFALQNLYIERVCMCVCVRTSLCVRRVSLNEDPRSRIEFIEREGVVSQKTIYVHAIKRVMIVKTEKEEKEKESKEKKEKTTILNSPPAVSLNNEEPDSDAVTLGKRECVCVCVCWETERGTRTRNSFMLGVCFCRNHMGLWR